MSSDGLQNFEIKLHPNPTSNYIYTNNNFRLEAEVFDIVGKLVMKEDFITKLDVSFLEKGTYILNLTDGINTTSHKIIKSDNRNEKANTMDKLTKDKKTQNENLD